MVKTEIDFDVKEKPGESGVMDIKERSCFRKEQEINTVEEFWESEWDEN